VALTANNEIFGNIAASKSVDISNTNGRVDVAVTVQNDNKGAASSVKMSTTNKWVS
jgi:hypothetical protein